MRGGGVPVGLAVALLALACGKAEGSDTPDDSGSGPGGGASGGSRGGVSGGGTSGTAAGGSPSGGRGGADAFGGSGAAMGGGAGTTMGGGAGTAVGGSAGTAAGGTAGVSSGGSGASCGDGKREAPEGCDDGNEATGDGCSPSCRRIVALSVCATGQHTCVILDDGSIRCWGNNWTGQLGLGDKTARGNLTTVPIDSLAVPLGTGRRALSVAAGRQHTCALLDDATIECWGGGGLGELGSGDTNARGDDPGEMGDALPTVDLGGGAHATAVVAGANHTCALLEGGSVKCWGYNVRGDLGLGDTQTRGDGPGEMGDALPAVDLGTGRTVRALDAGYSQTCAVLDNGAVKCWGQGLNAGLGVGATDNRGDGPNEMGDALPAVDLGSGRTAIAVATDGHSCALLDNAQVKCWGVNARGQLGIGDVEDRGDQPNELGDLLPAVDFGAGRSVRGGLTIGTANTCVILDDDELKCWGANLYGELGQGNLEQRGDQPGEMGDALPAVDLGTNRHAVSVTIGDKYICALLDDTTVKCWGSGDFGQLGMAGGTRGDQPGEMGDALPALPLP